MRRSNPAHAARSGNGSRLSSAAAEHGAPYAGLRALVVEADVGTRRLCEEQLGVLGFTVSAVETGVAGVAAARVQAPDVILVDLQLRDVPGLELAGWLRANPALAATPIIAINALAPADGARGLAERGIELVLRKPLSAAAVERAVRRALG